MSKVRLLNLSKEEYKEIVDKIIDEEEDPRIIFDKIFKLNGTSRRQIALEYGFSKSAISRMIAQDNDTINKQNFLLLCCAVHLTKDQIDKILSILLWSDERSKYIRENLGNEKAISNKFRIII